MESCFGREYYNALAWSLCALELPILMLAQYGSPFSDGVAAATQWPIPPGKYFDYEFQFADDLSGTLYFPEYRP